MSLTRGQRRHREINDLSHHNTGTPGTKTRRVQGTPEPWVQAWAGSPRSDAAHWAEEKGWLPSRLRSLVIVTTPQPPLCVEALWKYQSTGGLHAVTFNRPLDHPLGPQETVRRQFTKPPIRPKRGGTGPAHSWDPGPGGLGLSPP